jgi:hypothetical protein
MANAVHFLSNCPRKWKNGKGSRDICIYTPIAEDIKKDAPSLAMDFETLLFFPTKLFIENDVRHINENKSNIETISFGGRPITVSNK